MEVLNSENLKGKEQLQKDTHIAHGNSETQQKYELMEERLKAVEGMDILVPSTYQNWV